MSIYVQTYVWSLEIPPNDKLVALALGDYADDNGTNVYPSRSTLARKTGYSINTVRKAMKRLEGHEIIVLTRSENQRRSRCYAFVLPHGETSFKGLKMSPLPALRGLSDRSRGLKMTTPEGSIQAPIHKEPSYEPEVASDSNSAPVDMEWVKRKNDEALGRKRTTSDAADSLEEVLVTDTLAVVQSEDASV